MVRFGVNFQLIRRQCAGVRASRMHDFETMAPGGGNFVFTIRAE